MKRSRRFYSSLIKIFGHKRAIIHRDNLKNYEKNIYNSRAQTSGVVFPKTEKEIRSLVQVANTHQVPLYPFSRGKNWGLGSHIPVKANHVIVDLSQMNKILEFDSEYGVVRIQPGVSQRDLSNFLLKKKARYRLNVTGSAAESSILGNALERGVAHYGCRVKEVTGLEVILGTGKKLRTGGAIHTQGKARHLYPYGLGSDLTGLFFQSALGIVTSGTFRLQPIPPATAVVTLEPHASVSLPNFLDLAIQAQREGLLPDNLHISNENRRMSVMTPLIARELQISMERARTHALKSITSSWSATSSFQGSKAEIRQTFRRLQKSLSGKALIRLSFCETVKKTRSSLFNRALQDIRKIPSGEPSDDSLLSLGYEQNELFPADPAGSNSGTYFVVPLLPAKGLHIKEAIDLIELEFKRSQFSPLITLNFLEPDCFEAVVNLTFDRRDPGRCQRARATMKRTFSALEKQGFPPQRMSIFQMDIPQRIDYGHLQATTALKNIFDPQNIISRGRYQLKGKRT